jgi:hypothetical protein
MTFQWTTSGQEILLALTVSKNINKNVIIWHVSTQVVCNGGESHQHSLDSNGHGKLQPSNVNKYTKYT